MIRRMVIWTVAIVAILAQVAVGIAGPHGTLCVCSSCISIQAPGESCGGDAEARATNALELVVTGSAGCTECHPVPMPDTTCVPQSSAPAHPAGVDLSASRVVVAVVAWPSPPTVRQQRHDRPRHPSAQLLNALRTVVLTC